MAKNKIKEKINLKSKNILVILLALILLFAVIFFIKSIISGSKGISQIEEVDENSYDSSKVMRIDLSDIKSIKLNLKTADLRVEKTDTNPYIEYTNLYKKDKDNAYELKAKINDGNLDISTKVTGKELNMKNKIQILKIYLPKDSSLSKFKGKIGSGNAIVEEMLANNVDFIIDSGNMTFKDSTISGDLTAKAGDIKFDNAAFNTGLIKTDVGNIKIKDSEFGSDVEIESNIGDIDVSLNDEIKNYEFKAFLNVGNFRIGNISYRNIKNGFSKKSEARHKDTKYLTLTTNVGNITFNKNEVIEKTTEDEKSTDKKGKLRGDPLEGKERIMNLEEYENQNADETQEDTQTDQDYDENYDTTYDGDTAQDDTTGQTYTDNNGY
ncbi:MAG: DUF4097 family beta strand repeat-containing protein [Peptoniphilaceae bacterium]|nr:DUF4097 domain-containing protein [Peptoniphilaceae bacterium]MDD7383923.1 DUF4097 family beta strand repeat-containing protein [Peptoniphilaceae bacterium]MDY3738066.1 DUF4097 family beta strand repeat-containing protein [Peptoniphilaceae bacterium]